MRQHRRLCAHCRGRPEQMESSHCQLPGEGTARVTVNMGSDGRASFAEQVAALRSHAGMSLADVAAGAHIVRGYVHHIERGHRWPTQRVAKAAHHAGRRRSTADRVGSRGGYRKASTRRPRRVRAVQRCAGQSPAHRYRRGRPPGPDTRQAAPCRGHPRCPAQEIYAVSRDHE